MLEYLRSLLLQFRHYTQMENFNIPGLAREFNLNPEEMKSRIISTIKRAEAVTDDALMNCPTSSWKRAPQRLLFITKSA